MLKMGLYKVRYMFYGDKFSSQGRLSSYFKGKAIPLQALAGPEGSRRLRLPDFFKTIGT
jgi:hypothetical protein